MPPSDRIVFWAYRVAAVATQALPPLLARWAASCGGTLYGWVRRRQRSTVRRTLQRVYASAEGSAGPARGSSAGGSAELRRATSRAFRSYARYWAESFRLPSTPAAELHARMEAEGMEHLDAALAGGRGAILVLPHLGGWDFGGAWLASRGYRPIVVAEPLRPQALLEWFAERRRAVGLEVRWPGRQTTAELAAALRRGELVGLVADRDLTGRGVPVTLFGETTTLPPGPAVLSLRTGAPVLPAAVYLDRCGRHRAVIRPPLPPVADGPLRERVTALVGALARELEQLVARAPEQWHLLQPNWPSDPGYGTHVGGRDPALTPPRHAAEARR